jgi:hypothetical protein
MNPYLTSSSGERQQQLSAYLAYLQQRDGVADLKAKTLSKREAFFKDLDGKPVQWKGDFDRAAFFRNLDQRTEDGLDPRLTWLLGAAKANTGERYGVELELSNPSRLRAAEADPIKQYVMLEEVYHTRLLLDACRVFGLDFEMRPPNGKVKTFIHLFVAVPNWINEFIILCGEIVGVIAFQTLLENVHLFKDQPEVMERLRLLVREILIDELGHVAYCRSKVGNAGLKLAQKVVPTVAKNLISEGPEYVALAGGADRFLDKVAKFTLVEDDAVREMAFGL